MGVLLGFLIALYFQALVVYGLKVSEKDAADRLGSVGKVGRRGFRTLGNTCWDADVWEDQDTHLTRAMCAKTRSHRTSSRAAEPVLKKLHQGQCITIVALGSSMTFGNCFICWNLEIPERLQHAWPGQLKRWLDMKFPCDGPWGHTVYNMAKAASDAAYWSMQVNLWRGKKEHPILDADLVFVDTSVTDVEGSFDWMPALSMPPQGEQTLVAPYTELLIRQLINLPKSPWIVFSELSWKPTVGYNIWPGHWDAILSHLPVLKHYDIDQISYLDAFLPITQKKTDYIARLLQIDGGHPSYLGHQILAQITAHTLMEESHFMNLPPAENGHPFPDNNMSWTWIPPPLWMPQDTVALYDRLTAIEVIPPDDPFKHAFKRTNFEWIGERVTATSREESSITFWVDVPASRHRLRPQQAGWVNLGFRRAQVMGKFRVTYKLNKVPVRCGSRRWETDGYAVGLELSPFWTIGSSLRMSAGFGFPLPHWGDLCMIIKIQWFGEPDSDPFKFQFDDLTVLA